MQMALDTARGMNYLHNLDPPIVHRARTRRTHVPLTHPHPSTPSLLSPSIISAWCAVLISGALVALWLCLG